MKLCRIGIHDWTQWSQKELTACVTRHVSYGVVISEYPDTFWKQTRRCKRCGKQQDRTV